MPSGNFTADRRFSYAQALRQEGDSAAAVEMMVQVLELAPAWAEGLFALGEMLVEADRPEDALGAFRAYLAVDPADSMGATLQLNLLAENTVTSSMPEAYVRRLFDEYAPRFDSALTGGLKYRAPALLRDAIEAVVPGRRFTRTLDLGCGTGLAGMALRDLTHWLGGADLSPGMIKAALAKNIYDQLIVMDMTLALRSQGEPCDLIVAADSFVYLGDLAPIIRAAHKVLSETGVLAFTVQRYDGESYKLSKEHRFSHSYGYITAISEEAGFTIVASSDTYYRQEKGVDVPGLVFVMRPKLASPAVIPTL